MFALALPRRARAAAAAVAHAKFFSVATGHGSRAPATPPPPTQFCHSKLGDLAAEALNEKRAQGDLDLDLDTAPTEPRAQQQRGIIDLPVTFSDVARAKVLIQDGINRTPCRRSFFLSEKLGMNLYVKKELQQTTGSFKERGARCALLSLSDEQRERGVIAASAGNHALALAWHGSQLGIPVTVLMPKTAPISKVEKSRIFGADVVLFGTHIGEAKEEASSNPKYADMVYINGYDDAEVIAGAGTIGLEIIEQCPEVDAVVVPCGGGGLLAGIGLAVKTLKPSCKVYAVEPINCPSFTAALAAGEVVEVASSSTLADGLAVPKMGARAFEIAQYITDAVFQVSEKDIASAVLHCIEDEKLTVEGGGVAGLAALLPNASNVSGAPSLNELLRGKTVVVPLCGGNIDTTTLGRVIERGLAAEGRLQRFVATVSDRPGGIANLSRILHQNGASVKDIFHERAWLHSSIDKVQITCVIEVSSQQHNDEVRAALEAEYDQLVWQSPYDAPATTASSAT